MVGAQDGVAFQDIRAEKTGKDCDIRFIEVGTRAERARVSFKMVDELRPQRSRKRDRRIGGPALVNELVKRPAAAHVSAAVEAKVGGEELCPQGPRLLAREMLAYKPDKMPGRRFVGSGDLQLVDRNKRNVVGRASSGIDSRRKLRVIGEPFHCIG